MTFRVSARAILELGAELISSDGIALYELIKNAKDARSKAVAIEIDVVLQHSMLEDLLESLSAPRADWKKLKRESLESIDPSAAAELREQASDVLSRATSKNALRAALKEIAMTGCQIRIIDTGCGMSLKQLEDNFLTIGTPSKYLAIRRAEKTKKATPYLGEKGVGRLSAMRLGWQLDVSTARKSDAYINRLLIDWNLFAADPSDMLEEIELVPYKGKKKSRASYHGTTLTISNLSADWTAGKLGSIAKSRLSRICDPFIRDRWPFPIKLRFNGKPVEFERLVPVELLAATHGTMKGKYSHRNGGALVTTMSAPLYGQPEVETRITGVHLRSALRDPDDIEFGKVAYSKLGQFDFQLYWFNRSPANLKKTMVDHFESVSDFRKTLDEWRGVMVFRDGFQVAPYGDADDDWLLLDRQALKSSGFKLNRIQFCGRVRISRKNNPKLQDQTNREGLRDNDQQRLLKALIQYALWVQFKGMVQNLEDESRRKRKKSVPNKSTVENYARQARRAIKAISPDSKGERDAVRELSSLIEQFWDAYSRAVQQAKDVKAEGERFQHLAGIGLIIESVAHELTRVVERSSQELAYHKKQGVPEELRPFLSTLQSLVTSIRKRLSIVDPLTATERNRRRKLDLVELVNRVLGAHEAQFERHNIQSKVTTTGKKAQLASVVEGRVIGILENMIANSLYWLGFENKNFGRSGKIEIEITSDPIGFRFSDDGPGVPAGLTERVFELFFSTRDRSGRRGMGLYLARIDAQYHGGEVYIDDTNPNDAGGFSTFVVELEESHGG